VLQPPWLTRNVYALMRKAEKLNGLLKREDIDKTLYCIKEKEMRDYLVRIMERFEIAFTRPNAPTCGWCLGLCLTNSPQAPRNSRGSQTPRSCGTRTRPYQRAWFRGQSCGCTTSSKAVARVRNAGPAERF
jgi:hypothetical protein